MIKNTLFPRIIIVKIFPEIKWMLQIKIKAKLRAIL